MAVKIKPIVLYKSATNFQAVLDQLETLRNRDKIDKLVLKTLTYTAYSEGRAVKQGIIKLNLRRPEPLEKIKTKVHIGRFNDNNPDLYPQYIFDDNGKVNKSKVLNKRIVGVERNSFGCLVFTLE
jgi:hypothetical protein